MTAPPVYTLDAPWGYVGVSWDSGLKTFDLVLQPTLDSGLGTYFSVDTPLTVEMG